MEPYQFTQGLASWGTAMETKGRRFFVFNSCEDVAKHVSQVKTISDLMQLKFDIESSGTNLTRFYSGIEGAWEVCCLASEPSQRHLFLTKATLDRLGELDPQEKEQFSSVNILS